MREGVRHKGRGELKLVGRKVTRTNVVGGGVSRHRLRTTAQHAQSKLISSDKQPYKAKVDYGRRSAKVSLWTMHLLPPSSSCRDVRTRMHTVTEIVENNNSNKDVKQQPQSTRRRGEGGRRRATKECIYAYI